VPSSALKSPELDVLRARRMQHEKDKLDAEYRALSVGLSKTDKRAAERDAETAANAITATDGEIEAEALKVRAAIGATFTEILRKRETPTGTTPR
jgi:hypothetical protein